MQKKTKLKCANEECGKEFTPKTDIYGSIDQDHYGKDGKKVYCSKPCHRVRKTCPNCENTFRMKRSNQDYCSPECRMENWLSSNRRRVININKLESNPIHCIHCKKSIELNESMLEAAGLLGREVRVKNKYFNEMVGDELNNLIGEDQTESFVDESIKNDPRYAPVSRVRGEI